MVKIAEIDGRRIAYTDQTEFFVEVGRHQSSYEVWCRFVGDIHQAVAYYRGLNITNGYKKRLSSPDFHNPTLAVHE